MKLLEFKIREYHSYNWKTVDLNSDVCVFYSKNNSTGKTTLMRAIDVRLRERKSSKV